MKRLIILCLLISVLCPLIKADYINKPLPGTLMNHAHPLGNPVGCWFADGNGQAVDYSGNKNHGTLNDNTHNVPGLNGPAWSFDGTSDCISIPDNDNLDILIAQSITYILWYKPTSVIKNQQILYKYAGGGADGYYLRIEGISSKLQFQGYSTDGDDGTVTSNNTITAGLWTQIATVINSTNVTFYINGSNNGSFTRVFGTTSNSQILYIGEPSSQMIDGLIDDVKIYNRALTQQEITQLYRESFCMFEEED